MTLFLDGTEWSTGSAPLELGKQVSHFRMTTAVQVQYGSGLRTLSFLDTGCTLSLIGGEYTDILRQTLVSP